MNKWIKIEDRLPQYNDLYLVIHDASGWAQRGIDAAIYVGEGEWSSYNNEESISGKVTHWLPVPEMPDE